jgi:hypothetical protein
MEAFVFSIYLNLRFFPRNAYHGLQNIGMGRKEKVILMGVGEAGFKKHQLKQSGDQSEFFHAQGCRLACADK